MKFNYTTLIITLLISTNANAKSAISADEFEEVAFLESNIPNSGKVIPTDFDTLYKVALSSDESLKLGGKINFEPSPDITQEPEATVHVKYSVSF